MSYHPDWIQTYTGKKFDYMDPKPDQFSLEDISISLTRSVRWRGHTTQPYTVAAHIWNFVPRAKESGLVNWIFHEVSEAYIGDIPGPLKKCIPQIKECESKIDAAFAALYNSSGRGRRYYHSDDYSLKMHPEFASQPDTKRLDRSALVLEGRELQPGIPIENWVGRFDPDEYDALPADLLEFHYIPHQSFLQLLTEAFNNGADSILEYHGRESARLRADSLGLQRPGLRRDDDGGEGAGLVIHSSLDHLGELRHGNASAGDGNDVPRMAGAEVRNPQHGMVLPGLDDFIRGHAAGVLGCSLGQAIERELARSAEGSVLRRTTAAAYHGQQEGREESQYRP